MGVFCLIFSGLLTSVTAQTNEWQIVGQNINPANYYGITVANGMIGLVSSPEPMKVKDVVLNGAFDTYGRGRVSNILKVFNFANMNLDVDGQRIGPKTISNYRQTLDMQKAALTTTFDYQDKVSVKTNDAGSASFALFNADHGGNNGQISLRDHPDVGDRVAGEFERGQEFLL